MEKYFNKAPVEMVDLWRQFQVSHKMHSVTAGGANWRFFSAGHSEIPLVLLPGEELFGEYWFRLVLAMQKSKRLLAVTLPALDSVQDYTNGISALLDQLHIDRIDLLGTSLGGCIAQEFVRRFPQRVRHLVLANTYTPKCRTPRISRLYQRINSHLPIAYLRALKRLHLMGLVTGTGREKPFWRGLNNLLFERYLAKADKTMLLAPVRTLADFSHYEHYGPRDLVDWPGRVMIIESIHDPGSSARCQELLQQLYPQASVNTLNNAGHTPGYSLPVDFSVLVGNFLQRD